MSIDLFDGLSRAVLTAELGRQLQLLSEEGTCCAWDWQACEDLPRLCYETIERNGAVNYRGLAISLPLARWLATMVEQLGHWVDSDGHGGWTAYMPDAMRRLHHG